VLAVVALVVVLKLTKKSSGTDPVSIGIGDDQGTSYRRPSRQRDRQRDRQGLGAEAKPKKTTTTISRQPLISA